jgi:hypothetical protein
MLRKQFITYKPTHAKKRNYWWSDKSQWKGNGDAPSCLSPIERTAKKASGQLYRTVQQRHEYASNHMLRERRLGNSLPVLCLPREHFHHNQPEKWRYNCIQFSAIREQIIKNIKKIKVLNIERIGGIARITIHSLKYKTHRL